MGATMKHNGIEYEEETLRDVTRYDGGAMGGMVKKLPNGKYYVRWIGRTFDKFEQAASAAQDHERSRYEHYREFVMQYEKEAKE